MLWGEARQACQADEHHHTALHTQATSQRGWTLPKLEELHAKSKALEDSGFTTVHSPKLRASSRSALAQV